MREKSALLVVGCVLALTSRQVRDDAQALDGDHDVVLEGAIDVDDEGILDRGDAVPITFAIDLQACSVALPQQGEGAGVAVVVDAKAHLVGLLAGHGVFDGVMVQAKEAAVAWGENIRDRF